MWNLHFPYIQSTINGSKLSREDFLKEQSYQYRFYKLLLTSFKYIHYSISVISAINIRVTQLCNAIQDSCRKLLNVNLWNCSMTTDVRVWNVPVYTPWKQQKTESFLMFSGGIEVVKIGHVVNSFFFLCLIFTSFYREISPFS